MSTLDDLGRSFDSRAALAIDAHVKGSPSAGGGVTTLIANDEDITVPAAAGTTIVLYTALTAARVVTMPPASGTSQIVTVKDVNDLATDVNTITLVGDNGDTVAGSATMGPSNDTNGIGQRRTYTNDGTEFWYEIDDVGPSLNTLLGSLGGTDGDGNVYSIDFNPESQQLAFKCVTAGGDTWLTFVSAGSAGLAFLPAEGDPLTLTLENEGVKINGVVIDPNEPWPGG